MNDKYIKTEEAPLLEMREELVKEFYRKALLLQEEEKKKLSRNLHDETGQIVIALGAFFNVIEKKVKENDLDGALKTISENRKLIQEIAGKMKSMAYDLRPPMLDILGLPAALREYFSQRTKLEPIKIEFNENMEGTKLNDDVEIAVYRIVQEAIYNITKHSLAKNSKISLILTGDELYLKIEDNGKGFDVEEYYKRSYTGKMGLRGIKERVDILKGTFLLESEMDKGTRLTVILPFKTM
ncbi:MAG: sensor histidine kinase [Candidatus Omnitrophota bacterium]